MSTPFTLRPMQAADGQALQRLMETDPDTPGMSMTTCFQVDPYEAWTTLQPSMIGVVAEAPGIEGVVGCATVAFDTIRYDGQVLPCAFLENLKVHHAFRGQGLGTQLAQWRIERARERFGGDGVIITGTTTDNIASLATMRKWCQQIVNHLTNIPRPTRSTPPAALNGVRVRPAEARDLAEISDRSNRYFAEYNLYPPLSAEQLAARLNGIMHYRVAVDARGNLLAGAMLSERGRLMIDEFSNVPAPLRLASRVANIFPRDNLLRLLEVAYIWYEQPAAARYLWEHIRWEFREQASTVGASFDPRGPLKNILGFKRWHVPKLSIVMALDGPAPMSEKPLLCGRLRG